MESKSNYRMSGYKQFCKGGQRRTMEAGCGWRCVGHPQEVNGKWEIHRRYCKDCMDTQTEVMPEFNKTAGLMNGWKGMTNRNQQPNQMLTTAFVNGERMDILTNANTLEKSMEETRLTASILADNIVEPEPVLSKSQKKRMKEKARKARRAEEEDNREATKEEIADFIRKLVGAGNDVAVLDLTDL